MDQTILNYDLDQCKRMRQCFHALLIIFLVDLVVSVFGGTVLQRLNVDAKIMDIINFVSTILQMVVLSRLIAFQSRYRYTMIGWGVSIVITIVIWFLPMNQGNSLLW